MTRQHRNPTSEPRTLRVWIPALCAAVGLSLLGASTVLGGGGGGGVEIYPARTTIGIGPFGGGTGTTPQPNLSDTTIQINTLRGASLASGSRQDSGVRVLGHSIADVVYGGSGQGSWSLDVTVLSGTTRVFGGPGFVNLDGHYILEDAQSGDGEDLRLHDGAAAVEGRLLIVIGQRAQRTLTQGIPESYQNILAVVPVKLHVASVSLEQARRTLVRAFRGAQVDISLGLITRDAQGVVSSTWASFYSEDVAEIYEIETR